MIGPDVYAAIERGRERDFLFARYLSSVVLSKAKENGVNEKDLDTLLDARFFDHSGEIRIFRDNDWNLRIAEFSHKEADSNSIIEDTYMLRQPFKGKLTVRHIMETDEDGQAYVADSHLVCWSEV